MDQNFSLHDYQEPVGVSLGARNAGLLHKSDKQFCLQLVMMVQKGCT